jgi:hypothetical protein
MMNLMSDVKDAQEGPHVEPAWDQRQPAWYEMSSGGTGGEPSGISGADWLLYGAIAAVSLGIGVVNALSAAQDAVWHGGAYDVRTRLFWEMSSIVTIIVLAPLIFVTVRRMRRPSGWFVRIALAAAAILVFSTLHIAGMVGLRKLVMFLAGGSYDFHLSVATLVYEFRKDIITCVLIGGSLWLIDSRREAHSSRLIPAASPAAVPPPAPHMVWLRDGSARIRIEPRDILWISSAGNYVEYALDGGRTHLVRGTLAGEEARLTKFNIVRVHRTRLVNLSRVTGLRAGPNGDFEVTLDAGQAIPGSRRYRGAVASIEALASAPVSASNGNDAHP